MFAVNDLPEHLEDEELLSTLGGVELADRRRYNPTLGLLLKLRSGLKRLIRRNRLHFNSPPLDYTESKVLFTMWEGVSAASAVDLGWGDAEALFHAGDVLSTKNLYLWSGLSKELNTHPLLPPAADGSIAFYKPFVDAVIAYQTSLERPVETFEDRESRDLAAAVKEHPRETCPVCCNRKHIYCGSCGGVRMPSTEHLLPPRIRLPFDVLLLVHWHETLHKCTGVHTAVLSEEGTVGTFLWTKAQIADPEDPGGSSVPMWGPLIRSLDADRDVILFPSEDSTPSSQFEWNGPSSPDSATRYRLIVLEATWVFAKGMARSIADYRSQHCLPPLRCVRLEDVVGQYWRFHEEGNSALSTVEAIAHTAASAGLGKEDFDKLLTLFRIQKGRVLLAMETDGWKIPRAVCTKGFGEGDWAAAVAVPLPVSAVECVSHIAAYREGEAAEKGVGLSNSNTSVS